MPVKGLNYEDRNRVSCFSLCSAGNIGGCDITHSENRRKNEWGMSSPMFAQSGMMLDRAIDPLGACVCARGLVRASVNECACEWVGGAWCRVFFYVAVRCRLASYSHCTVQPHSSTETRRMPLSLSSLIGAPVTFSAAMFYESSLQYRKIGKSLMRGLFAKVKRQAY